MAVVSRGEPFDQNLPNEIVVDVKTFLQMFLLNGDVISKNFSLTKFRVIPANLQRKIGLADDVISLHKQNIYLITSLDQKLTGSESQRDRNCSTDLCQVFQLRT